MIQIGCVADDFTGASDWASFFAQEGISTVLYNGIPEDGEVAEGDVAVIALKSRTSPTEQAVEESLRALRWLKGQGASLYYIKYCSTFDCTRTGNIGPVTDAAMDFLKVKQTILCPALPVNGRTVRDGCLFVNGIPLQESSMKDHPLTPMWDCRLRELMKEQGKGRTVTVEAQRYGDIEAARKWVDRICGEQDRTYFVPDFYCQEHGKSIVEIFGSWKLLTGGSGLCTFLAKQMKKQEPTAYRGVAAPAILIAGSCSEATLRQIRVYQKCGKKSLKIQPARLLDGTENVETLWEQVKSWDDEEILLFSSEEAAVVAENQKYGKERIAALIEQVQAELAKRFVQAGRKRVIVAGGETSGAITRKLGYRSYSIGKSIAPGVPVMTPDADPEVRLVLKSGNFGQEDFFLRALAMTKEENENDG
ncbi:MAG: four-carbon acid sugar kinase family protein [Lachnospiraceae bacterium]|nr:four-carbon acid sugar kinase family protein [Lachnospiraceae bacterium]